MIKNHSLNLFFGRFILSILGFCKENDSALTLQEMQQSDLSQVEDDLKMYLLPLYSHTERQALPDFTILENCVIHTRIY